MSDYRDEGARYDVANRGYDITLQEGRKLEIRRIRSTRCGKQNEKQFQQHHNIALLMSCPCSKCYELYKRDGECIMCQMPFVDNGRPTMAGTLHRLKRTSSLDPFYDIHDTRTIYGQCFDLNRDNTYQCVCCGFIKKDAQNTDEESLSDLHAKTVPTCPLLILTKGKEYIHNKLQEVANEIYEKTGNSTIEMQTMLSVIRALSRDGSDTVDDETAKRIIHANVRFFLENGGLYGNSEDILRSVL